VTADERFERHRDRLFGLAYRMTGSVADADDLVQEAWLRWQRAEHDHVRNDEAFLVSVTTRLALDRLSSATARRVEYVGPWLPEPLVDPTTPSQPEAAAVLADSLTFAFLVLLDSLSPPERAVFLLREVFGYGYDEVAAATGRTEASCRQLVHRARRKLDEGHVELRRVPDDLEQRMLEQLVTAIATGDLHALVELLAPDVVLLSDGGPDRHAARVPVRHPDRVARLCISLGKRLDPGTELELIHVNGAPALLLRVDGRADNVLTVQLAPDGRIRRIFSQLNPAKLTHLG